MNQVTKERQHLQTVLFKGREEGHFLLRSSFLSIPKCSELLERPTFLCYRTTQQSADQYILCIKNFCARQAARESNKSPSSLFPPCLQIFLFL